MTPSHHAPGGGFQNPGGARITARVGSLLKWKFVDRPYRVPLAGPLPRATPAFVVPRNREGALSVTWVGHSTLLVQIGAVNVLTDPMWSDRASPVQWAGPRRLTAPGVPFEALPPIDVVLQSHDHYDHLDDRTVRRIAAAHPDARWVAPLGVGPFLRARGVRQVTEHDWWDETDAGGLRIACAPAQHFSGRGFRDRNRSLWCSWAVRGRGAAVYFGGDTGYHGGFADIGARLGPFDVALLPVGAYDPRWFMRPVHMDPEEAVRAYRELQGPHGAEERGIFVPIHWGTFRLTDEPVEEPPALAERHWRAAGLPGERFWRLAHGETRTR